MKRSLLLVAALLTGIGFSSSQSLEVSVQRGHSASVKVSKMSEDGKILATGGRDKSVIIWEVEKGRELRSFPEHEYTITDISFHPDGKLLASADAGGALKIWDYQNGGVVVSWLAHKEGIVNVNFDPTGKYLLSSGIDDLVYLWDWENREIINSWKLNGGQYGVRSSFGDAGKQILLSGDNAIILNISLSNSAEIDTLRETTFSWCGGCYSEAKFSPNGNMIAGISHNGPLVIWDLLSGKSPIILNEKIEDFNNLLWTPDGGKIILSQPDVTEVYDVRKKTLIASIPKKEKGVNHVSCSSNADFIFLSTDANTIEMHSLNGDWVKTFKGKLADPIAGDLNLDPNSYWEAYPYKIAMIKSKLKMSPNGKWAIKGKTGNKAIIWDIEKGKPYRMLSHHEKTITAHEFSPDNKILITGDVDGNVVFWDILSGDTICTKRYHFNMLLDFAISRDGKLLATGGYDGYLNIIELETFRTMRRINVSRTNEYVDSPFTISFSPNDNYLIVGTLGKELKIIEIDTGEDYRELIGHTDVVSEISFVEDKLITCSWDGKVKAWDLRTGYQEWKTTSSSLPVYDLIIIEEKNWIVTAGADRKVRIFDLDDRLMVKELTGHTSGINSLNYLPDRGMLVSSTIDGEVKYWDTDGPEQLTTQYFTGPEDYVILDQNGFFNATRQAKDAVVFVNGLKSYQPEQFFDLYFRPGLQPLSYQHNRSIDNETRLTELIEKFPPPQVDIIVPKNGAEFPKAKINVVIKTTNTGGGVENIQLAHNGKTIVTKVDADSRVQQRGKSLTETYEFQLLPGKNVIEASAVNKANLESEKSRVVIEYSGDDAVERCFIMVVGINKYKNTKLNLNYAADDARSFSDLLKKTEGTLFQQVEVIELFDKDATKENILANLEKIVTMSGPSDTFYFYFAGHGSMVENHFYFIPTDNVRLYDKDALENEAISDAMLQEKFKKIAALKQVVIIDACQSGGGVQTLALRGVESEKALAQLSRSAGVHVLASAGSEQYAAEFEELGHGLFTYALIEALQGKADGSPRDGSVSVYELKSYLDAKVPVYSEIHKGEAQYPFTFSIGQDFPILIQPNKE